MEQVGSEKKTVRLNIGGTIYKCLSKTLTALSESRLANLEKETDNFDFEQNEFYFDRNPILFAYILDSFRKGAVHLPKDICGTTFKKELEFWEIPTRYVAPCCWEALYGSDGDIDTVKSLVQSIQNNSNETLMSQKKTNLKTIIWLFLDEPRSSRFALVWSIFISFAILSAILVESLSSVDTFQVNFTEREMKYLSKFADALDFNNASKERLATLKPNTYLMYTGAILHGILTLELILSFAVCPDKKNFVCCYSRLVACFGYMCYWISFAIFLNMRYLDSTQAIIAQPVFAYLSVLKIARLFYITKGVPAFRLICLTFSSSTQELKILAFLLGICVFVFGYSLYVVEGLHNSKLTNVFAGMYWTLITLTTVGYGDYVPVTVPGHVIAGICAVCGVLVLALPVGIIVSKFYKYYDYYKYTKVHILSTKENIIQVTENVS